MRQRTPSSAILGTLGPVFTMFFAYFFVGEAVSIRCEALLAEEMYDVIGTDLHNERCHQFKPV